MLRPFLAVIAWLWPKRRNTVPSVIPTPDLVVRFAPAAPRAVQPSFKRASTDEYVAEALAATSTVVPTPHADMLALTNMVLPRQDAVPRALAAETESKPIQVIVDPPSQPIERAPRRLARGSTAPVFELDDEITNVVSRPFAGETTEPSILLH